jgi:hypothetical protein
MSLTPLQNFSSTLDERRATKRPPPLFFPADFGMPREGAVLNSMPPASHDDKTNRKHNRQEDSNFISTLVKNITTNPTINFFNDAFITKTDDLNCPQLRTLLKLEELAQIISDIKEFINPDYLLPPSTERLHEYQQKNTQEQLSLKTAEALYDKLLKIKIPQ